MNNEQFEGKWDRMKDSVRWDFDKLTDEDIEQVRGRRQNLLEKIQKRYGAYGASKETAAERLNDFERRF